MIHTPRDPETETRQRRRRSRTWIMLAPIAVVCACVITTIVWQLIVQADGPHDLQLSSIAISREVVAGRIDAGRQVPVYANLLRIDLTSKVDIQSYAVRNRLSIWFFASPCRNGGLDTTRLLWGEHFDSVFDQFGRVDVWSTLPLTYATDVYRTSPSRPRTRSGKILYRVFLDPKFTVPILPEKYHYDLSMHPVNVCLVLHGQGNMWAGGFPSFPQFWSNVVFLPRQGIVTALSQAHLQ